ncbi:hypothetical protein OpiT1DRAFT_03903 [Opitutaceae bacterium TAV1]|nr:hypothetical protein OpiT1DRAFT_03903 [Opitutaceae bacterium TAV1]
MKRHSPFTFLAITFSLVAACPAQTSVESEGHRLKAPLAPIASFQSGDTAANHAAHAQIWPIVRSSDPAGTLETLLVQPTTDGIIYYIGIARIARVENELAWDWSDVDHVLKLCHLAQKPVKLALLPGRWVPEWFYEKGAQKFTWSLNTPYVDAGVSTASAPVPWDDTYLSQLEHLVSIAAARYTQHPALAEIQITGPALANGLEMNLNISAEQAASIGYSPEKLTAAWKRMLDHYAAAFPKQKLSLALHNQIAGERTTAIAKAVLSHGFSKYGNRLGVLICYATWESWFDRSNNAVDVWLDTPSGTKQEAQLIDLYSVKNTPLDKVSAAITRACNLGANTLEVFSADLLVEPYRQAIDAARRATSP